MFSAGSSSTQRDQRPTATPLKGSEGSSDLVPPAVLKAQEGDKTWRNQGQTATPLKVGEGIADRLVLAARKAQEADQTRRLPHGLVSAATPSERINDQTRMPEQGRHLYLVFDDWCSGYSIMKVSLSPHSVSGENAVQRLPLPFVRLVAPRGSPKHFVSAFGSWILAMHPRDPVSDKSESYFPMLNVVWQGITFGPGHGQGHSTNRIYLSVGEKLFTLSTASIEMLCLKENVFPPAVYCSSMDCSLKWSRKKLARPPFKVDDVISYALQPDQQTFLVSTNKNGAAATFTFDTVALSWKLLGNWALPFDGRGHFDPYLQSFVGISKDPNTLGQLYMCGLPIGNTGEGQCPAPVKKLFREKLFSQDPAERHVSATLIYMGYQSKFCLVQCLSIEEDSTDQALVKKGDVRLPGRCLYRVTTFFFSGDLKIKDRQVQYYEVPKATTKCFLFEDPVAFWM